MTTEMDKAERERRWRAAKKRRAKRRKAVRNKKRVPLDKGTAHEQEVPSDDQ